MTASSLPFESGCSESRLNLNMYGVFGISNIIAILAPQCKVHVHLWNHPPYQSNTTSFEDSGLNLFLQKSLVQRIYFPDKLARR